MSQNAEPDPSRRPLAEASAALNSVFATMTSRKPDFGRVLAVLQPFKGCHEFADATPEQSAFLAAMISATLGDCYREDGQYEEAAELYCLAGKHRPIVGFETYYAEMVVRQKMQSHYESALEFLLASQDEAQLTPMLARIRFHFARLWRDPRSFRLSNPLRSRRLIRELNQLTR
jgi:hypothetical protein